MAPPQQPRQPRQSLTDLAYRTAAGILGGPVDIATMVMRPLGYRVPDQQVVGGSEWMGRQMERAGLISSARAPVQELLTSLLVPTPSGAGTAISKAIFIGAAAKTWDAAAAAKAKELEKAGADARSIWQQTGTWKGPDGKWRQEIDDSQAKLRDYNYTPQEAFKNAMINASIGEGSHTQALSMRPYAGMTKNQLTAEYARTGGEIVDAALSGDKAKAMQLNADRAGLQDLLAAMRDRQAGPASSYMRHSELGQAYPDVYKLHTRIAEEISPSRGAYLRGDQFIGEQVQLANKPRRADDLSTLLHELQHAIQQREGFAKGGNPTMMRPDSPEVAKIIQQLEAKADAARDVGDKAGYVFATDLRAKLMRGDGFGAYRMLAGEAEARAVQARMNLTPAERRATFPPESYDVPIEQLIIRGIE